MTVLRAHFDGKVLVPDGPVDLPIGQALEVQVTPVNPDASGTLLQRLARIGHEQPSDPNAPVDGAAQHDHYLYGQDKRR